MNVATETSYISVNQSNNPGNNSLAHITNLYFFTTKTTLKYS